MNAITRARASASRLPAWIALLLGTLAALAWLGAAVGERRAMRSTVADLRSEFEAGLDRSLNVAALEQQAGELRLDLDELVRWFPGQMDPERTREQLQDLAAAHGVELTRAGPAGMTTKEFFGEIAIDVGVRGPALSVYQFLASLASNPPLRRVPEFRLAPVDADGAALEATLRVVHYRYVESEQ